ncbi:MAG: Fpg/Nei family DNA glycosylase [Candidatus Hydrogenedentota bacterium]|nr:MAG: Fpg/Nei family DNA glycosylase [Candidatus Hydrogenedentota bacterium]
MAEGPVVHYYSRMLAKALKGRQVDIELGVRKLKAVEPSLRGIRITDVSPHGKQFRIRFSDGRILLVHLMMWGSWRIYRKGAKWDKPYQRARVILRTDGHEAVAFSAPVVRVLTKAELENEPRWGNLGPDPLRTDFSEEEFFRRLDKHPEREIGEVIMDQQVLAGIGNILKNEILFRAHVHPGRLVSKLSTNEKQEILRWAKTLSRTWLEEIGKRKRNSWISIYRKSGKPCPDCGHPIQFFRQAGRVTYACPTCQK